MAIGGLAAVGLVGLQWAIELDRQLDAELERPLYTLPTALYARPFELAPGDDLERIRLLEQLERTGYQEIAGAAVRSGEFAREGRDWWIGRREFPTPEGLGPPIAGTLRIETNGRGQVRRLFDARGKALERAWLEPVRMGVVRSTDVVQDREIVTLYEVPKHLVDAIVIAEDRRFFEHDGIDPRRILGAAIANLKSGEITQGGSTLTQQLVKNLYVGRERTLARKLREAALSVLLERRRDKRAILEAYLNEMYLGQDGGIAIHGVARAARHYFGRAVGELDVARAALLAGIVPGPALYDPFRNPGLVRERRDWVLREMHAEGAIDAATLEASLDPDLRLRTPPAALTSVAYFTDHLRKEVRRDAGAAEIEAPATSAKRESPETVDANERVSEMRAADGMPAADAPGGPADAHRWAQPGHALVTTLDWRLQAIAEQVIASGLETLETRHPDLAAHSARLQAALVALDPRSGELLAIVGGRQYSDSQFNRATQAARQPGSVFKPIVALAALGREPQVGAPRYTLASTLVDEPLLVPSTKPDEEDWEPENYDSEFRGPVSLRQAFEHSLNVPVARLAQEIGLHRVVATARKLGLHGRLRAVPSLPLGTFEVTLLDMTSVYGVFAAGGLRAEPHSLLYTLDAEQRATAAKTTPPERVASEDETYLVYSLLRGVVDNGTARSLPGHGYAGSAVGKTGTTNDYRDAWFIGYTPNLTVGVWVGFDDGHSVGGTGSERALPIFADFMREALGPRGGVKFERPRNIQRARVITVLDEPAGLLCDDRDAYDEIFLPGSTPQHDCRRGLAKVLFPHRRPHPRDPYDPSAHRRGHRSGLPDVSSPPPRRRPGFIELFEEILGRRTR